MNSHRPSWCRLYLVTTKHADGTTSTQYCPTQPEYVNDFYWFSCLYAGTLNSID